MKIKLLFLFLWTFSITNAQITWDFKTGTEGWGSYGDNVDVTWDGLDNLVLNYTGGSDGNITYPTIYNDTPLNVANVNYFYIKFMAINWPKSSVLVNIQFEINGNNYYANQTMNATSGEFSFNIRNEVQHTWSVLPATGTTSRLRIEIPHNSELAGYDWKGASLKIDKIAFLNSNPTGLIKNEKDELNVFPNPASDVIRIVGQNYCKATIIDMCGKIIKEIDKSTSSISVSNLTKGVYFIKIEKNDNTSVVKKLIIK